VETVSRVLAETGLPASALELEITEGVEARARSRHPGDAQEPAPSWASVRNRRLRHRLRDLRIHQAPSGEHLEARRSVRRRLCENADDAAIVAASVALARGLGLRLVAEGVETAGQHQWLRALGCDECQGHYVHRPLPAAALEKILAARSQSAPADRLRLVVAH